MMSKKMNNNKNSKFPFKDIVETQVKCKIKKMMKLIRERKINNYKIIFMKLTNNFYRMKDQLKDLKNIVKC